MYDEDYDWKTFILDLSEKKIWTFVENNFLQQTFQ